MSLLNPILMLGAAFAAVPIIIHFLNKTRFRVEPFGGMMFLRSAMRVRAQTLKLRQLLLLLLRVLLFILLALALARPVQRPRGGVAGDQPTTHVLVLDGSMSMHQGQGAENAFHKAREAALQIVDRMQKGDNAILIWAGRKPSAAFPRPIFDREALRAAISEREPGFDSISMADGIEQAYWALDGSTLPRRRIYLLSDGQKSDWRISDTETWDALREHRELLKVQPVVYLLQQAPEEPLENAAVAAVYPRSPIVDIHRPTTFIAELANHTQRRKTLAVTFAVDGNVKTERSLSLAPGVHSTEFDHLFREPGSHYVTVTIPSDDLTADDTFVYAVHVMARIPVLIIDGTASENPWQADGALLKMALEASGKPGESGLFQVKTRAQTDMDGLDIDFLNQFKTVVLANVTSLSEFFLFALERFVEQGGGLLIAVGDQPVPSEYNRMYKGGKGLLPAQLGGVRTYQERFFQPTFPAGRAGLVLDIFDVTRTRSLNDVNVRRYWTCTPAVGAVALATFEDDPFLVYKPYGKGRTILWTTSISDDWTNFPFTQDYLPLVQNLAVFLSANVQPPVNLKPGDALLYSPRRPVSDASSDVGPEPVEEPMAADAQPTCKLTLPDGRQREIPLKREGGDWLARWQETAQPGLYQVAGPNLPRRFFAVALDPTESNPMPLSDELLESIREDCPLTRVRNTAALVAEIRKETGTREWWRGLMLAAVALLCLELYLGWRFSR